MKHKSWKRQFYTPSVLRRGSNVTRNFAMFSGRYRPSLSDLVPAPQVAVRRPVTHSAIVAVQGAASPEIQALLARLARRWTADGVRVAGVVEETSQGVRNRHGGSLLRNLHSGTRYSLYQDLGPHSTACCLDQRGVAEACQHVIADLPMCDVVVLSKFGKLETERGGLLQAFIAAALLEKPVVTAVSPAYTACYLAFVDPVGAIAPPDEEALYAWGRKTRVETSA